VLEAAAGRGRAGDEDQRGERKPVRSPGGLAAGGAATR